jgi:hypothetical protein
MNIRIDTDTKAMHVPTAAVSLTVLHSIAKQHQHISLWWDVYYLNHCIARFKFKPVATEPQLVIDVEARHINDSTENTPAVQSAQ